MSRPLVRTTICTYSMSNLSYSELSRETFLTRNNSSYPHKYVILFKSQHSYSTEYGSRICFVMDAYRFCWKSFSAFSELFPELVCQGDCHIYFQYERSSLQQTKPNNSYISDKFKSLTNFFKRLSPVVPRVT